MSGPFKLKYTKNSFPFKSLEKEIIKGAGEAEKIDPEGLVAKARQDASKKVLEGLKKPQGKNGKKEKEDSEETEEEVTEEETEE